MKELASEIATQLLRRRSIKTVLAACLLWLASGTHLKRRGATMKPWTTAAFELLEHAELHRIEGGDFDRRTALIAYDNAIEISIATYLGLHPSQREGLQLPKADIGKWLVSHRTKLEFLEHYVIAILRRRMAVGRDEMLYFHKIRNDLYHGVPAHVPSLNDVKGIRAAALWVFAVLFKVDPEPLLAQRLPKRFNRNHR